MRLGLKLVVMVLVSLWGARARAEAVPDSVLLLGLHVENIEGYAPMFSAQGRPRTDGAAGYRTVVLHIAGDSVRLASELPYLAVPQSRGFLYLGEVSVKRDLQPGKDAEPDTPHFYDATVLWRAWQRTAIPVVEQQRRRALERGAVAGAEDTTQVVYVTSKALCVSHTTSEWTGGALAFQAQHALELTTPTGAPLAWPLSRLADRSQLEQFMHHALANYGEADTQHVWTSPTMRRGPSSTSGKIPEFASSTVTVGSGSTAPYCYRATRRVASRLRPRSAPPLTRSAGWRHRRAWLKRSRYSPTRSMSSLRFPKTSG